MKLSPRYDIEPVLVFTGVGYDPLTLLVHQRARLAETLAGLDESQWSAASRCAGWSVQDVITHLVSTNSFWSASIALGLAGRPTRFLADFDPVASPAQLVAAAAPAAPSDTLAAFVESNLALAATVATVGDRAWSMVAEAPPGHIAVAAVALHALWDSLIHEFDVMVPLGLKPLPLADELAAAR